MFHTTPFVHTVRTRMFRVDELLNQIHQTEKSRSSEFIAIQLFILAYAPFQLFVNKEQSDFIVWQPPRIGLAAIFEII